MTSDRFTSFDGTGIAFQRWAPGGGAAVQQPPVLLHHGFAVDANLNWAAPGVVERLVHDGFDVIGVDARGHGASDKPHDPARYGEDTMAKDVAALVDHLGLEQFDLVGYSMGAIVSVVVACEEPRLRRLAVGGVGSSVVELGGVDTRVLAGGDLVGALLADDPASIDDPNLQGFRALADLTGADREALAAQAGAVRQGPLAFDAITARALVLVGEDDILATRPEVLADALGGRLVFVPGDHMTAVGTTEFADALAGFLSGDEA